MKPFLFAVPTLLGLAVAAPALAQQLPTVALAASADTRQGNYFDAYGSRIFYQVSGTGTPMVLIHGYPLSGALFSYQQAALAARFTVITLDLPGFGKSSPTVGANGSPALYARNVLALMDHLNLQKAIVGGHSMGGIITQELYREAPSRFSGMILIDTVAQAAPIIEQAEWAGYGIQSVRQGVRRFFPTSSRFC